MAETRKEPGPERPPHPDEFLTLVARGLAHEIKNPLSTMAINLTLLEEEFTGDRAEGAPEPSPRDKRCLKRISVLHREVSHLENILDDFLRFARGGQINRAPGDLVALVREVLDFTAAQHQSAGIVVHAELPTSLPLVLIDSESIRRVLMNLLVNARQAMPGGGELICQLRRDGPWAELRLTDTGVGMDEEQLSRCFDLYWSTKRGGTGLGLSTVRRTILEHGGRIGVISEPGRGTSFTIHLPLVQELAGRPEHDPDQDAMEATERPPAAADPREQTEEVGE
ncbi:MAG: two-component sensor histidine kinase [Planctomycetes bacterium]|nr:two-component sensor histidine kinase [Planctomycetota bacterium]MCB9909193.1 two-component sensor histidine kinase [Planctomycetota bacterium]HPF15622.1 ATP-binding protein [Planctomycetota bacterium]HRV82348.1 ATP-binding protein [Planctomycetota bacterium]